MKSEPSRTLREVWALKQAAQEETKGLSGPEYFAYIHREVVKLRRSAARRRARAAAGPKRR